MIDILHDLETNDILLLISGGDNYGDKCLNILKQLKDKNILYLTLNKTSDAIIESCKNKNVNTENIFFIDGIGKTVMKKPEQTENCVYISSPSALTEMSLAVTSALKSNFDVILFDSLTSLIVYTGNGPIVRFVSAIIANARAAHTKLLLFAVDIQEQKSFLEEVKMLVDKTVSV